MWCNNPEVICAVLYTPGVGGSFIPCDDCHKYLEVKDGQLTNTSCPDSEGWGFNSQIRKCENRSPQCL